MSRRLLIARPGHIYLATYNPAFPTITIDLDVPFSGNPSWFAVSPAHPDLLYTSDEDASTTCLFELDLASNSLIKVAERHDGSEGVCHVEFNRQGTIMVDTSWGSGTIDVWKTENRSLELVKTIQSRDALLDAGRVARAHQAVIDPTGRFFIITDLGTDSLLVLDSSSPDLPIVNRIRVPSGSGPRHGVFYPGGKGESPATHYILLCETSNRVIVFSLKYTDANIELAAVDESRSTSTSTFMPDDSPSPRRISSAAAGEIVLSRDDGHIYTSNRPTAPWTGTIAHFRILTGSDPEREGGLSLELDLVAETCTGGRHPRMFSESRDGGELFVGNQEGEWAVVVLRRKNDGTLEERPVAGIRTEELVKGGGDQRGPMFVLEVV
ncbi:Lactonase, 7-bladed beta-propeller domain-containing protein [Trichoderma ceciliae]